MHKAVTVTLLNATYTYAYIYISVNINPTTKTHLTANHAAMQPTPYLVLGNTRNKPLQIIPTISGKLSIT